MEAPGKCPEVLIVDQTGLGLQERGGRRERREQGGRGEEGGKRRERRGGREGEGKGK